MKTIVNCPTWLRGEGAAPSVLLRPADGKQCCIGFTCEQGGIPRARLMGAKGVNCDLIDSVPRSAESNLHDVLKDFISAKSNRSADWVYRAYFLNDEPGITDAQRKEKLTALFAANGQEIEFIN